MSLRNGIRLIDALDAWIFDVAVADRRTTGDPEVRGTPQPARSTAASVGAIRAAEPKFDRPDLRRVAAAIGLDLPVRDARANARRLYTIGDESHQLIEGISVTCAAIAGFASNRLLARDATPEIVDALRRRFFDALRDRDQRPPESNANVRMLEKTPKNALRVPFLASVFPEARFIYLHRDRAAGAFEHDRGLDAAGVFGRIRNCRAGPVPPWSLLLVPGWQELIGAPLHEIVAAQWRTTTQAAAR